MPIIVDEQPFWRMVVRLREFEGWRCLWRVPVAALLYAIVPLAFVGATVLAAYIAGDDFDFRTAVASAIVVVGATALLAPGLARRHFHRKVIADRLWTFEKPNPATQVFVLLRSADEQAARLALRRAKLNPQHYGLRFSLPPPDAPDLDHRLAVQEPAAWAQAVSDEDRIRRIAGVLTKAGIRARVGGIDTNMVRLDRDKVAAEA